MDIYTTRRIGFPLSIIAALMSWVELKNGGNYLDLFIFVISAILMYWLYKPAT